MGRRPERRSISLLLVVLLSPMALAACGPSGDSRLVITQSTDAPSGADHKGHLSPGSFTGITLSIRNTGAGPARGVTVEDVLPAGFHYYELTTLGGNAIRTALTEPDPQGNPTWGTWTIPAGNGDTVSALVLSFKVQATVKPGDYVNQVKLTTSTPVEIDQGTGVGLVVERSGGGACHDAGHRLGRHPGASRAWVRMSLLPLEFGDFQRALDRCVQCTIQPVQCLWIFAAQIDVQPG